MGRCGRLRDQRGYSVAEFLLTVVIFVLLLVVVEQQSQNFRVHAKTSEAKSNLGAIRSTEVAYFAEWNMYVGHQPYTPVQDRRGKARHENWVANTRFSILGFAPEGAVFYSYGLVAPGWSTEKQGFTACAAGDLDGDGEVSTFCVSSGSTEITHWGDPF